MLMTALKFQVAFDRIVEMDKLYKAYLRHISSRKKIMLRGWAHLDVAVNYVTMQLLAWRNDDTFAWAGTVYACALLCTYFEFDCCFRVE